MLRFAPAYPPPLSDFSVSTLLELNRSLLALRMNSGIGGVIGRLGLGLVSLLLSVGVLNTLLSCTLPINEDPVYVDILVIVSHLSSDNEVRVPLRDRLRD